MRALFRGAPKNRARRGFLLAGLAAGGALIVGVGLLPPRQRLRTAQPLPVRDGAVALNGWLAIEADGSVSVVVARSEMGQGVHTALPMLVAEELDMPLSMVRLMAAPIDKIYANVALMRDMLPFHPDQRGALRDGAEHLLAKAGRELGLMFTGGSTSVRDAWGPMREAGALARAMLVAAAAEGWQVAPASCTTEGGFVRHPSGRTASYASLAARAATVDIDADAVAVKTPAQFTLIGRPQPRRDSPAKVTGAARFGIDARPPGLLYAAVRMAPVIGAGVGTVDASAVRARPGVKAVINFSAALGKHSGAGAGLAVIATTWWGAHQAAAALAVSWTAGSGDAGPARLSTEAIFQQFRARLDANGGRGDGHVYHSAGSLDALSGPGLTTLRAEYRAPFLAHAAMEPINCTAQVSGGKVKLWASTQVPSIAVDMAAKVAGVAREDVTIEVLLLGGGFGRRLEVDMVAQAVAAAAAADGMPVQLIWTREDDMMHDVYRPAALARFTGSVDGAGKVHGWDNHSVSGSIGHQYFPRSLGLPGLGPDKTAAEGEYDMAYDIANQRIAHEIVASAVPIGYFRSVGHSHNAFFKESFVDELAHAAGQDGAAFRRSLLHRQPRHLAVLDAALKAAGAAPAGRAHGVAVHACFGSVVAQVAQVSIEDGAIRVHRVVCAIDCGLAVNPNIIAQQMESAVVFGLSAALGGEITVKDGRIEQSNYHDYPVLRIGQAPQVDTIIIASAAPPEGVGEPGVPPVAPAVANAVFILTGQRLRSLPLRLAPTS
ncbi:molybdopterin cofactor-binding domain-containing protein [Massilia sp. DWR3-1-1]|uniref:xanthine dehydrogenase family protein molybdopterin-binding subunit n=1 Tax=Massilia sp. DWR3-1-1 TaxID=2804559 RepID=UPI003CEACC01